MKTTIFYCWQSDLPNATNRSFIEKALDNVAKAIRSDDSLEVEPDIDRDTRNVPGAPDIADTIFTKIKNSDIFVCDVSLVNTGSEYSDNYDGPKSTRLTPRLMPNPNVLIELGYALSVLGSSRVLLVYNAAFGSLEQLPFDLHTKRVLVYTTAPKLREGEDRGTERKRLESSLEDAIRSILAAIDTERRVSIAQTPSIIERTIEAIEHDRPTQATRITELFDWLLSELDKLAPKYDNIANNEYDEPFVAALDETQQLVIDFAKISSTLAMTNAKSASLTLYRQFSKLLNLYKPTPTTSGSYYQFAFDFYKFIGHELFVTLISLLLREERWDVLAEILETDLFDEYPQNSNQSLVSFAAISSYVQLFEMRNRRLNLRRVSVHADTLNIRHKSGILSKHVPIRQFAETDYFLFLRAYFATTVQRRVRWYSSGVLYVGYQAPQFLLRAQRANYAFNLIRVLGVSTLDRLKEELPEATRQQRQLLGGYADFEPLSDFDVQRLGSQ